jgi:hypothetical protein
LHTALPCPGSARGGHFSKGLAGYNIGNGTLEMILTMVYDLRTMDKVQKTDSPVNIGNVQQFLKNTCSVY